MSTESVSLDDRFSHLIKLALEPQLISLQSNLLKEIQQVVKNELKLAIQELKVETEKNLKRREFINDNKVIRTNCAEVDLTKEISGQSIIADDGTKEGAVYQKENGSACTGSEKIQNDKSSCTSEKNIHILPEPQVPCIDLVHEEDEMPSEISQILSDDSTETEVPGKELVMPVKTSQVGCEAAVPVVTFVPPVIPKKRSGNEMEARCAVMTSQAKNLSVASGIIETDPGPSGESSLLKRPRMEDTPGTSHCDDAPPRILVNVHPSCSNEPSAKEKALVNYVILKSIFSMLDAADLNNCLKINNVWSRVATRLYTYIDIDCRPCHLHGCKKTMHIVDNEGKEIVKHHLTWENIAELVEALSNKKIYMIFGIGRIKMEITELSLFLHKCGHHVALLDLTKSQYLPIYCSSTFFEFIGYFCNLRHLILDGKFAFPDLSDNLQVVGSRSLQIIKFGIGSKFSSSFVTALLEYAINLRESFDYPLELLDCLAHTRKHGTIRSVSFPSMYNIDPETVKVYLVKLASLQPKLDFLNWGFLACSKFMRVRAIRDSIEKIIESSKSTIKWLVIERPTGPSEFLHFPTMCRLNHIVFQDNRRSKKKKLCSTFFQPGIDAAVILPNVKAIDIRIAYTARQEVNDSFPREVFKTFGPRIETLEIWAREPECIEQLAILFPNITRLEVQWSPEMSFVLEQVYNSWKSLKRLELTVRDFSIFSRRNSIHSLDAAVTGLDVETLTNIKTGKTIMQDAPGSLSKLTHLQKLYISIDDKDLKVRGGNENFITTVTIDYIKCHKPELQIFLGIPKGCARINELLQLVESEGIQADWVCDDLNTSFEAWRLGGNE